MKLQRREAASALCNGATRYDGGVELRLVCVVLLLEMMSGGVALVREMYLPIDNMQRAAYSFRGRTGVDTLVLPESNELVVVPLQHAFLSVRHATMSFSIVF